MRSTQPRRLELMTVTCSACVAMLIERSNLDVDPESRSARWLSSRRQHAPALSHGGGFTAPVPRARHV